MRARGTRERKKGLVRANVAREGKRGDSCKPGSTRESQRASERKTGLVRAKGARERVGVKKDSIKDKKPIWAQCALTHSIVNSVRTEVGAPTAEKVSVDRMVALGQQKVKRIADECVLSRQDALKHKGAMRHGGMPWGNRMAQWKEYQKRALKHRPLRRYMVHEARKGILARGVH